jgi:RHS repeat-associated core domain
MNLYPNGYININQDGYYTKHYYADEMRVASKIGKGFNGNLCNNLSDSAYLNNRQNAQQEIMLRELENTVYPSDTIRFTDSIPFGDFCYLHSDTGKERELFFYHGNHLSSTQMITDNNGELSQLAIYAPFGEVITEINAYWELDVLPSYLFNAKELDEESGMYYYSARYYAPPTFISRDPLFEKFPFMSPYAYCMNNPVIYIDPTGKIPWPILSKYKGFTRRHENNFGAPRPNGRVHIGLDFNFSGGKNTDLGAPILATHTGVVTRVSDISKDKDAGGNRITITSEDGRVSTSYMHLEGVPTVKVGDKIAEGQQIGTMGGTGKGNQDEYLSHLHYELRIDGQSVNPVDVDGNLIDPQLLLTPQIDGGTLTPVDIHATNLYVAPKVKQITEIPAEPQ